ncbi:MAG: insulinase family protein [Candidatus Heimdallarchaeota archaeon]|nr:insulinase family protein [Candidatus Heimdallarchaeota archaeon]
MNTEKVILARSNLQTISIGLSLPIGSITEPSKGINSILLNHMTRSTQDKDEETLAEFLDNKGISLYTSPGRTYSTITTTCPPKNITYAIEILQEIIGSPEFDESTINQLVQRQISQIEGMQSNADSLLGNYTRWNAAFGDDPITNHPTGDSETLQKLTPGDLEGWYQSITKFKPKIAAVGIDINEQKMKNWGLDDLIGQFGNIAIDKIKISGSGIDYNYRDEKSTMKSENSYLSINLNLNTDASMLDTSDLLISLLSGGFSSRMFKEIRGKRNLSYSPYAIVNKYGNVALISSLLDVRPERAEEGIQTTLRLMHDTLTEEIPKPELMRALKVAQRITVFVSDSSSSYTNYILSRITSGQDWEVSKIKTQLDEIAAGNWQQEILSQWQPQNLSFAMTGEFENLHQQWQSIAGGITV